MPHACCIYILPVVPLVAAVVQAVVAAAAAAVPLFVAVVACQHAQLYRDEKKK